MFYLNLHPVSSTGNKYTGKPEIHQIVLLYRELKQVNVLILIRWPRQTSLKMQCNKLTSELNLRERRKNIEQTDNAKVLG